MKYPLDKDFDINNTKDKILFESSILFAHKGYTAVSMRNIADKVNIKASSIYNHFKSKEELYDAILNNIEDIYLKFYERLDEEIKKTTSFQEVWDCFFLELVDIYHMIIFYGISFVSTEQYREEKANRVFSDVYMKIGIDYAKRKFDMCIEKKWVKPFDTQALAYLLMNSVFAGTIVRTHEDMKQKVPYESKEMFKSIQKYVSDTFESINK